MSSIGGKYTVLPACSWCGETPAREYVVQKNGTKEKRYAVTATACDGCARRMDLGDDRS